LEFTPLVLAFCDRADAGNHLWLALIISRANPNMGFAQSTLPLHPSFDDILLCDYEDWRMIDIHVHDCRHMMPGILRITLIYIINQ